MNAVARRGRRDLMLTVGALLALVAWERSGLDLPLARLLGNSGGFPLREHFLLRSVLHDGGRWLAGLLLAALILDAWRPIVPGPGRRHRVYWLAVVAFGMTAVSLAKRFSTTSCPWDLAEFGGRVLYVPHWMPAITDGGPGHCFPSGHAVAAFAFFGTWFLWRDHRPRLSRAVLAGVLVLGGLFTGTQMARGAHFASHGLWSAWLCWTISAAAQLGAPQRGKARALPDQNAGTAISPEFSPRLLPSSEN